MLSIPESFSSARPIGATVTRTVQVHTETLEPTNGVNIFFAENDATTSTLFDAVLNENGALDVARSCLVFLREKHPHLLNGIAEQAASGTPWLESYVRYVHRCCIQEGYRIALADLDRFLPQGVAGEAKQFLGELLRWAEEEDPASEAPPAFKPTPTTQPAWNEDSYRSGYQQGYFAALEALKGAAVPMIRDEAECWADAGDLFEWIAQEPAVKGVEPPVFKLPRLVTPREEEILQEAAQ